MIKNIQPLAIGLLLMIIQFNSQANPLFIRSLETLQKDNKVYYPNGNQKSQKGTVTDIDGNVYQTVVIGNQEWMAENLKTTKYSDGTDIIYPGSNLTDWETNTTGAYAWYNNDSGNKDLYGALYNWYSVNTQKLCPSGWHVPTNTEWEELRDFIGGSSIAGGKLKSTRTDPDIQPRWDSPNTGATDEFGFSALPSGYRNKAGGFSSLGTLGFWWTSVEHAVSPPSAKLAGTYHNSELLNQGSWEVESGLAVRCVKRNVNDDIIGYFPFNGNANDESGNGNNATVYGGILTTDRFGNENSAYDLTGDNHYIETPITDLSGSALTIAYWFKGSNIQSAVRQQSSHYIVAGWNANGGNANASHILSFDGTSSGVIVSGDDQNLLYNNEWHFVAVTWETNTINGFKSYLNGNIVDQRNSADALIPNINTPVIFGKYPDINPEYFNGIIDDVRLYKRALTSDEILQLFNEGVSSTLPTIVTSAITDITQTSAFSGGNITNDGGSTITTRGVVWSTADAPTLETHEGSTNDGSGMGQFTSSLTGLQTGTTYYIRAYATNSLGTAYGNALTFTTLAGTSSYSLTFNLDMTNVEGFDPSVHKVYISGTHNNWAEPGTAGSTEMALVTKSDVDVLLFEDFEGEAFPPSGWLNVDSDADSHTWFPLETNGPTVSSTKSAASESYTEARGGFYPDNWLITHQLFIPDNSYSLEYYVSAQSAEWPAENYGIFISTNTRDTLTHFNHIFFEKLTDAVWHMREISLSEYAGQNIYIAFRHYDSFDNLIVKIDDITVSNKNKQELIYTATVGVQQGEIQYKYFSDAFGAGFAGGEWAGDPNRTVIVTSDLVVNDIWGVEPTSISIPSVNTSSVTSINQTSAISGGTITDNGGGTISSRGVVWSTSQNPTLEQNIGFTSESVTTNTWESSLSNLSPNTTYYVRAYATNEAGTGYGGEVFFMSSSEFTLAGTWKIAPIEGALSVYPSDLSSIWWQNTIDDLTTRACLFDDEYVFNPDGSFKNILGDETWLELWQGVAEEGCGAPVAPHNGQTAATWAVSGSNLTINGKGTFIGLAKAYNGGELSNNDDGLSGPDAAPESITYSFQIIEGVGVEVDTMVVEILVAGGDAYWKFILVREVGETIVAVPSLSTSQISSISQTSAISGGAITDNGGGTISSRGVVWSTSQNPTLEQNIGFTTESVTTNTWQSSLTNLSPNTTYYVRSYATNEAGTGYGQQLNFTTLSQTVPTLTTKEVVPQTATSATGGGIITSDGGAAVTQRGVVWSTIQTPTIANYQGITNNGSGTGEFNSSITGLSLNTRYYIRAYAVNSNGVAYGNEVSFTTANTVTFAIVNPSDQPIQSASVFLDGELKTTDVNGRVVYLKNNGNYFYTITATGYLSSGGSLTVDGQDVLINIKLAEESTVTPTITGEQNVCQGSEVFYSINGASNGWWDVIGGEVLSEYESSISVRWVTNETSGMIRYHLQDGIYEIAYQLPININTSRTLTTSDRPEVRVKGNLNILVCVSPADSYKWVKDGSVLDGESRQYYIAGQQSGEFRVEVVNGQCPHSSSNQELTGKSMNEVVITVYPNPTNGQFTLLIEGEPEGEGVLAITNAFGKVIHKELLQKKGSVLEKRMYLQNVSVGVYIITFRLDEFTTSSAKLTIQ